MGVELTGLVPQRIKIENELHARVAKVLDSGTYILGPEVVSLEERLAAYSGADFCVSCGSGSDALAMVLMAWGVGLGDAVYIPAFTFAATAEAVTRVGATPVFVDVDESFNMCPESLQNAMSAPSILNRAVVIPVDMFGRKADYRLLCATARAYGAKVLCDSAQSFGAELYGEKLYGDATAVSFFPSKPLGCYGDGGAVLTNSGTLASDLFSIREHGRGSKKYEHVRTGLNSRLDAIQAAILHVKLDVFDKEVQARRQAAYFYHTHLKNCVRPEYTKGSVWAQYTIRVADRPAVMRRLAENNIQSAVYYPTPLCDQVAYSDYPSPDNAITARRLCREVLSIPMNPYLKQEDQRRVAECI